MNHTETKQVLDALKFAYNDCESDFVRDQKIDPAIAICEASLARVVEPVATTVKQKSEKQWFDAGGPLDCRLRVESYVHGGKSLYFVNPADCDLYYHSISATPQEAAAHPADGFVLMPIEPTYEIISAMACSKARDDEGEFPALMDHIDYSGESKTHTVLKAAYRAAINAKVST